MDFGAGVLGSTMSIREQISSSQLSSPVVKKSLNLFSPCLGSCETLVVFVVVVLLCSVTGLAKPDNHYY